MNLLTIFLQETAPSTRISIQDGIIETLIFVAIGMAIAFAAFKLIDLITPGALSKQIAEDGNVALAIVTGALILGVCIIIAAVLSS
ncbi:MAG TPA: DUF350 domain-containing protein [Microscillaceae bacterium]|nr:DUF350 domain-containing protein [Microscillaceae bacterium]